MHHMSAMRQQGLALMAAGAVLLALPAAVLDAIRRHVAVVDEVLRAAKDRRNLVK